MKSDTVNAFNKIVSFNIANEQSPCGIKQIDQVGEVP